MAGHRGALGPKHGRWRKVCRRDFFFWGGGTFTSIYRWLGLRRRLGLCIAVVSLSLSLTNTRFREGEKKGGAAILMRGPWGLAGGETPRWGNGG
jgi:hypothetical protein